MSFKASIEKNSYVTRHQNLRGSSLGSLEPPILKLATYQHSWSLQMNTLELKSAVRDPCNVCPDHKKGHYVCL